MMSSSILSVFVISLCLTSTVHARAFNGVDGPKILSVISTIEARVTVRFYPGTVDLDGSYNFTVSMQTPKNIVLCQNQQIVCGKRKCECIKNIMDWGIVKDRNVTVIVSKQTVEGKGDKQIINLIEHIKPGPLKDLRIRGENTTSPSLVFCAPEIAFLVIREMKIRNHPLTASVTMVKTQGVYEQREFTVIFTDALGDCVQILLSQLAPFTRYNLSVTASGGGGRGKSSNISFISRQTAPLSSPRDILYWIVEEKDNNSVEQQKFCSFHLNWKPIPHEESGGEISYEILVSNDKRENLTKLSSTEPYAVVRKIPDTSVFVEIYARNKMGMSNSSHLTVYRNSVDVDVNQLESHVEIDQNQAKIFLQKPQTDIEITGIYTCIGYQDIESPKLIMCKEPPRKISNETSFSHKHDSISAVVSIMNKDCAGKSTTVYRQEVCSFYENRTQNLNVSVTTMETASCSLPSSHDQFKFLFSIKKNGRTIPRLFPFKCYYDSKLDTVRLNFQQTWNEERVSVAWKQFCDFDHPRQFLPRSYDVFTSKDKRCQSPDKVITEMNNTIIHPSVIELLRMNIHICVESFKSSEKAFSYVTGHSIVRGEIAKTHYWIVGCIPVIMIIVFILLYRRRCQRRKVKAFYGLHNNDSVFERFTKVHTSNKSKDEISKQDSPYHQRKDSFPEPAESGISSSSSNNYINLQCGQNEIEDYSNPLGSVHYSLIYYESATDSGAGSSSSCENTANSKCTDIIDQSDVTESSAITDSEEERNKVEHSSIDAVLERFQEELQSQGFVAI